MPDKNGREDKFINWPHPDKRAPQKPYTSPDPETAEKIREEEQEEESDFNKKVKKASRRSQEKS